MSRDRGYPKMPVLLPHPLTETGKLRDTPLAPALYYQDLGYRHKAGQIERSLKI